MAVTSKNTRPINIVVTGTGPDGQIVITDFTDSSVRLAEVTVDDRDTNPDFRHNTLTVVDPRFEIRDGGLYLKEGVHLEAGSKIKLKLRAQDDTAARLSTMTHVTLMVTHEAHGQPGPIGPLAAATLSGDTLTLNFAGDYAIKQSANGAWHITHGGESIKLTAAKVAGITSLQLHGGITLNIAGAAVDGKAVSVHGAGNDTLNITGVTFTPSAGGVSVGSNIDLTQLMTDTALLVNGSITDAFKARFNALDDLYFFLQDHYGYNLMFGNNGYTEADVLPDGMSILGHTTAGAAALAVNEAVTQLDLAYANYLHDGGSPNDMIDFIAKTNGAGTREQSLHDNLLGSVNISNIGIRNFPEAVKNAFIAQIPGDYGTRPYAPGNFDSSGHTDASTNAAKAWDYGHGVDRPDYVTHFVGALNASGTKEDGTMWFGVGNPSTGYAIAVHDGVGVEFGFNVHYRTGDQIAGHLAEDGLIHFDAPSGHQILSAGHNVQGDRLDRSLISLDYAEITGLNGTSGTVANYVTKLHIDTDPTAAVAYKDFTLVHDGEGVDYFVQDNTPTPGGTGDEDGLHANVSTNSFNFGFGFLTNSLTANSGDLQAGRYDVYAEVFDSTGQVLIVGNHIVLDVADVAAIK